MIICFTGTGNSRYVACELARLLGEDDIVMLGNGDCRPLSHVTDSRAVWVFPTYSWGVPPVVARAMRMSSCSPGTVNYMVTTCGDDTGLIAAQWRRLMRGRGTTATAYSVIMPNTYTLMRGFDVDAPEVAAAKLAAAPARIAGIARRIAARIPGDDMHTGRFAWFKSRVIYPWFVRFAMSPRPFAADPERCTRCGLCARSCPCMNISVGRNALPQWGSDCALCLRCYHICPAHAVGYGKATDGKGQYMFNEKNMTNI